MGSRPHQGVHQGARTYRVNGSRKEVSEKIQMDGFPRECG